LGCPKRYVRKEGDKIVSCRTSCEDWEKIVAKNESKKQIIRQQKNAESIYKAYASDGSKKTQKRKRNHGGR
jgi:hypothetical protein